MGWSARRIMYPKHFDLFCYNHSMRTNLKDRFAHMKVHVLRKHPYISMFHTD